MRVPHKSAQPVSVPGTGYQALRHDTVLNAPKQQMAEIDAFAAPARNTAAIIDGVSSLMDTGAKISTKIIAEREKRLAAEKAEAEAELARKIAQRLQDERDAADARDSTVALNESFTVYAWGDGTPENPGEYGRKGKDAFDAVPRTAGWYEKETSRLAKNMSPRAAALFRESSARLRTAMLPDIARHEARERNAYAVQSLTAHAAIESRNALASFTDPLRYNEFVARKEQVEWSRAAKMGLSGEEAAKTVAESTTETLAAVFERQVEAGEFQLAETLFHDPRLPDEKRAMLADSYRRARLEDALAAAKQDPESAKESLAVLTESLATGKTSPLDFTRDDLAALENQIDATTRRREAEKMREEYRITRNYEGDFAAALRSGDMGEVLKAEEHLLKLGKEREALRSKHAREAYSRVRPLLESARNASFADQAAAVETAFAPLLPAEETMDALMAEHDPLREGSPLDSETLVAGPVMPTIQGKSDVISVDERKNGSDYDIRVKKQYTAMESLPPAQWEKKARTLPIRDRFGLMTQIDEEKLQTDETLQRRVLALSGVPSEAIDKAFAPAPEGMDKKEYLRRFRESITLDMLPKEMHKSTRDMIGNFSNWAKTNRKKIATLGDEWKTAKDSADRESILITTFQMMQEALAPDRARIEPDKLPKGALFTTVSKEDQIVIKYDPGQSAFM